MPVVFKYILHMVLLIAINFFSYTYIPTSGQVYLEDIKIIFLLIYFLPADCQRIQMHDLRFRILYSSRNNLHLL